MSNSERYAGPSEDKQIEIVVAASPAESGWGAEFKVRARQLGLAPVDIFMYDNFTGYKIAAYLTIEQAERLIRFLQSSIKWAQEHPTGDVVLDHSE